jgi:hypothetical protein
MSDNSKKIAANLNNFVFAHVTRYFNSSLSLVLLKELRRY